MFRDRAHPAAGLAWDVLLGLVVLGFGLWTRSGGDGTTASPLLVLAATLAAAGARLRPAWALALIWVVAVLVVVAAAPALCIAPGVAAVGFRCARYGARPTVWLAGISVPVGAAVAIGLAVAYPETIRAAAALTTALRGIGGAGAVGGFLGLTVLLGGPYAVGLLVRVNERYRTSRAEQQRQAERAAAEHEIAQSRAIQAQLARDVHDVVGHSLAVIVAQADAARLVSADDRVRTALGQIAEVGRSSLAEIRDVLGRTRDLPDAGRAGPDPDELVAGVRAAGNDVRETVTGAPRPLDPALGGAVYRVLQELLTNALKHGSSGGEIAVEREWTPDALVLRVTNLTAAGEVAADGMGLTGVRERVAGVGGSVRTAVVGGRFVVTAVVPA